MPKPLINEYFFVSKSFTGKLTGVQNLQLECTGTVVFLVKLKLRKYSIKTRLAF